MLAQLGETDGKRQRHVDDDVAHDHDPQRRTEVEPGGAHQQPHADEEIGYGQRQDDDGLDGALEGKFIAGDPVGGEESYQDREQGGEAADQQRVGESAHQPSVGEGRLIPAQRGTVEGRNRQVAGLKREQHQYHHRQEDEAVAQRHVEDAERACRPAERQAADHSRAMRSQRWRPR